MISCSKKNNISSAYINAITIGVNEYITITVFWLKYFSKSILTQFLGIIPKFIYLFARISTSIHIAIINQATFWSRTVTLSLSHSQCVCLTFWESVELFQTYNKNDDCFWIQHNKCVASIFSISSIFLRWTTTMTIERARTHTHIQDAWIFLECLKWRLFAIQRFCAIWKN